MAGPSSSRYRRIATAAASALAGRGLSVLVGLAVVPMTVGYLGAERYGAWMTISSLLSWLQLADLGLGNGLTNALADARGRERPDLAQRQVATAFWMLVGLASLFGLVMASTWTLWRWADLLNLTTALGRSEVGGAVATALAFALLAFPLVVVEKVYLARQEGAAFNGWIATASLLTLATVALATRGGGGLVTLVLAFSGTRALVSLVNAGWLFGVRHRELAPRPSVVDARLARGLAGTGAVFFAVQLGALVLNNTDNIVIARVLGAAAVAPYAVAWRLFSLPGLAMSLVFPYLWPAYTEALARGDLAWVRRTATWTITASTALGLLTAVPLVALGSRIIRVWAGPEAVPTFAVIAWMGAWSCIVSAMSAVACLLNATGRVRGLLVYGLFTAGLNVGLSIWWAGLFGTSGVIAATVIAYAVGTLVPATLQTRRYLRSLAT